MNIVDKDEEFLRIDQLPRRETSSFDQYADYLHSRFRREGSSASLRPMQIRAICDLWEAGGGLVALGVGHGKTLVSFLIASMFDECKRPCLIVPASLVDKTRRDLVEYRKNWHIRDIKIISYHDLSLSHKVESFYSYNPDMVICDEVHNVKDKSAGRTKRLLQYMDIVKPIFVGLSGTVVKRSLRDFAHLLQWGLHENSPLPLRWRTLETWSNCVDPSSRVWTKAGALGRDISEAREYVGKRLRDTAGFITASDVSCSSSLLLRKTNISVNDTVKQALSTLDSLWITPDGIDCEGPLEVARYKNQLSHGFYYRWKYPAPKPWLQARKEWSKFVRDSLSGSSSYFTEFEVANACRFKKLEDSVYNTWKAVKDSFQPTIEAVWLDKSIAEYCASWSHKNKGLVWVQHQEFGKELDRMGLPYFGQDSSEDLLSFVTSAKPCALSYHSHREGKNLQMYDKSLVFPTPDAAALEQLIGRTHRQGQESDEVQIDFLLTTPFAKETLDKALDCALYLEKTSGSPQRLKFGSWLN